MSTLGFFRRKARPIRVALDDPSKSILRTFLGGTKSGLSYGEAMAAEAAMHHPVVYRCLHKIALAVQDVGWYVDVDPDAKGATGDLSKYKSIIQDVLNTPNDNMSASQLRYWLGLNKALYNRFALKIGASTEKKPNAIYPLAAPAFKTVVKSNGFIERYEYGNEGASKENLPTRRQVDPGFSGEISKGFAYEYITPSIDGIDLSLVGRARNNTPLNAIGLPTSVITMLLQRARDTASGQPNLKYIISGEKTLTGDQEDAIKDDLDDRKAGEEESGNILFLGNTSIKVDTLDNGMSDIHSKIPMDDMSRIIYSNYGIPVALAGIGSSDAAKFAGNYESSRRSFFEDTIIPNYLGPISDALTTALCPPGLKIFFDYDTISGLGDARANKAKSLQGVSFLTRGEKRVLCGFNKDPAADDKTGFESVNPRNTNTPSNPASTTEPVV